MFDLCSDATALKKKKKKKEHVFKVRAAKAFVFNFQHEEKHFKY